MYFELHTASAFSFLAGASLPETLIARAAHLGYPALALLDRDGVYGAPQFYRAARAAGLKAIVGAELTIGSNALGTQHRAPASAKASAGKPSTALSAEHPALSTIPVLVASADGYRNLCRLITQAKRGVPKGESRLTLEDLDGHTSGLIALVGRQALMADRYGVGGLVDKVVGIFGRQQVWIELQRHLRRDEEEANASLLDLAAAFRVPVMASNGVRFATVEERPLYDVLTCLRHKTTLKDAGRRLSVNAESYLKPPEVMARLFSDLPQALAGTEALAERLDFTLANLGYQFPDYPVPAGETQASFLRRITMVGARDRYHPLDEAFGGRAKAQIQRELDLIDKLNLAGYFLIVWDLVNFCRQQGILVQGRGSAANSAVCYSLGVTAVDPIGMELLFERFLSEEREEWPDIDLDLPSGERRERVIQYLYQRYGALGAAMTANVITYRGRSAAREVGKVLSMKEDEIDRLAKMMSRFEFVDPNETVTQHLKDAGLDTHREVYSQFARLWTQMQDLPRHLGQHSGGMVICKGRLDDVVPLEPASMPGRVVVQWDKDDCADLGIVKVDLLGLGMMAVLEEAVALTGIDLAHLPQNDPEVYRMLQAADTVGIFQVESRAQMATLPRLKPKHFYDIVVEVALIRPGPIVGQMVHPYLKRRRGDEPVAYAHPSLEPVLKRTLGVPLFQEQLLRMAMVIAGFSGGEAEELRRAMGFKRSVKRMQQIETRLRGGMARNGITGVTADQIVLSITSFALYGFPESHAASFALIVYASAYLKAHYPAAFYAALLNNQPMGFYAPATLVKDAQRRGVRFAPMDVQVSDWVCTIQDDGAIRLGLMYVQGLRAEVGKAIARIREKDVGRLFQSMDDLVARIGVRRDELRVLAESGALATLGGDRRSALWQAERAARPAGPLLMSSEAISPEIASELICSSPLPPMSLPERVGADYAATGLTIGPHPMALVRRGLAARGVLRASDLALWRPGRRVRVAGAVITRQRPGTAKGFVFLSLEDETGIANAILTPDVFSSYKRTAVDAPYLLIEGLLQNQDGAISVKAERLEALGETGPQPEARNFH
ncbi:MAG: DNA polymerase III subunit alpha [Acidimicrobiia bacterium]|nr:DNA polymerase III subunit alpha [Acidimicrobiia bacterium]